MEMPIEKCNNCHKELKPFEGEITAGKDIYDKQEGLRYHTGKLLCKNCFKIITQDGGK